MGSAVTIITPGSSTDLHLTASNFTLKMALTKGSRIKDFQKGKHVTLDEVSSYRADFSVIPKDCLFLSFWFSNFF